MIHTSKLLPKSQILLTITVPLDEYKKNMERAAERLSLRAGIRGFRPGKAPYDIMVREVGENTILQEALESIVQESYTKAIKAESLETIGMPKINIKKLAPGNDVQYEATVALLPNVDVADLSSIKAQKKVKEIDDKKIDETIKALQGMQAKETATDKPSCADDKIIIDMNMMLDNVPVEGGQAKNYQIYLSEEHYIPGFNKELLGLKNGDEKKFTLTFPAAHYQKMLAGKNVEFSVKVKEVFERALPAIDDEFAKALGQKNIDGLRDLIKKNLLEEADAKAEQQMEIEILDSLIKASKFDEIPDVIIDAERQKMFFELKRDLERNGVPIEKYLEDIKKKEEDLINEFKEQAEKRAKAALVSRHIALKQNLIATKEEIDAKITSMGDAYKGDNEAIQNLKKDEVRDTIASIIQNRKVMDWLKGKINPALAPRVAP